MNDTDMTTVDRIEALFHEEGCDGYRLKMMCGKYIVQKREDDLWKAFTRQSFFRRTALVKYATLLEAVKAIERNTLEKNNDIKENK